MIGLHIINFIQLNEWITCPHHIIFYFNFTYRAVSEFYLGGTVEYSSKITRFSSIIKISCYYLRSIFAKISFSHQNFKKMGYVGHRDHSNIFSLHF